MRVRTCSQSHQHHPFVDFFVASTTTTTTIPTTTTSTVESWQTLLAAAPTTTTFVLAAARQLHQQLGRPDQAAFEPEPQAAENRLLGQEEPGPEFG